MAVKHILSPYNFPTESPNDTVLQWQPSSFAPSSPLKVQSMGRGGKIHICWKKITPFCKPVRLIEQKGFFKAKQTVCELLLQTHELLSKNLLPLSKWRRKERRLSFLKCRINGLLEEPGFLIDLGGNWPTAMALCNGSLPIISEQNSLPFHTANRQGGWTVKSARVIYTIEGLIYSPATMHCHSGKV